MLSENEGTIVLGISLTIFECTQKEVEHAQNLVVFSSTCEVVQDAAAFSKKVLLFFFDGGTATEVGR